MRASAGELVRPPQLALLPVENAPDDDGAAEPRRGRPPGALNVAPLELRRYVLAKAGNPVLRLARIANADTLALARELGAKPLDVLTLQVNAAKAAAPFVASPMPSKLEIDARQWLAFGVFPGAEAGGTVPTRLQAAAEDVLATIAGLEPTEALQGRPLADPALVEFLKQKQGVTDAAELPSNVEPSNVEPADDGQVPDTKGK